MFRFFANAVPHLELLGSLLALLGSFLGLGLLALEFVELGLEHGDRLLDAALGSLEVRSSGLDELELGVEGREIRGGLLHARLEGGLDLEVLDLSLLDVQLSHFGSQVFDVGDDVLELLGVQGHNLLYFTDPGFLVLNLLGLGNDILAQRLEGRVQLLVCEGGGEG